MFVAVFVGLGLLVGAAPDVDVLLVPLVTRSLRLPLRVADRRRRDGTGPANGIPSTGVGLRRFAILYGLCETMNGNWSQLDMTDALGASTAGQRWR